MSFKYLNEQPLKSSNNLEFGHKEIVTTIDKIIVNQSWNITIGLFGNWGTGKSTIVESLRDALKPKKIPMIIFDVWKHDGDALRRTFLKECASQLNSNFYGSEYLDSKLLLDDRLVSATTKSEDVFSIKWQKLLKTVAVAILFGFGFFVAGVMIYALLLALDVNILDNVRSSEVTNFFIGGITASIIFKFFETFIKTEKIDIREDKYQDPHEFELEFKKLVEALLNTPKKVVITFDNLDRVSGDSALSIISTIKTFLDIKSGDQRPASVIFLIPCDIDSMKRHIRQSLKSKEGVEDNQYIDEFLRKFFNTSIWIPDFHGTDLEKFATAKLAETQIPEFGDAYLSWLIIKVFNKNPRQIIQFVNHLVSNYLLFEQVCLQNGLSDAEFHKKNVPQLAKFLLIKQRHPDCLELYRSGQIFQLENEEILNQIKEQGFKDLLRQTADIYIPSLEPYFKGRVTSEEQQFPGIVKLLDLMKYEVDEHLDHAKSLQLAENSSAFDSILKAEFNRLNNPIGKTVFLNHLLDLTSSHQITLSQGFYRDIINFLLSDGNNEVFYKIDALHLKPEIFAKAGQAVTLQDQKKVLGYYINIVCDTKKDTEKAVADYSQPFYDQVFEFFTVSKNLFSKNDVDRLKKYFLEHSDEFDLRHHFFKDEETQQFFIDDDLVDHFLKSFSANDSYQAFYRRLDLIHRFHPPLKNTEPILAIYGQFWNKMFISADDDGETAQIVTVYKDILRERIEMATVSGIGVNNSLIDHIYRHIRGVEEGQIDDWVSIIHRMLGHEAAVSRMTELMSIILSSGNENNITALLALFPNREDLMALDTQLADEYLTYLSKQPVEEASFAHLSDNSICKIIEKLVNWREFSKAEHVVTSYRDKFGSESKMTIFKFLTEAISEAIEDKEPIGDIEVRFKLMLLLSDLNPEILEQSGFWNILPQLLGFHSSEEESELAKRLILENHRLLSPKMAEGLFNTMISSMDSQGNYNNAQFHETLNILRSRISVESQEIYMDRILRHIVRHTSSHNVTLLAAEAIEKSKFNVDGQLANILDFENYINSSMTQSEKERIRPVLLSILKVLKHKPKVEVKDLIVRLQEIAG